MHPDYRRYIEAASAWRAPDEPHAPVARPNGPSCTRNGSALQAPVGSHYLIGDQVSLHPGWQEGAIHSALHAIADIDRRERASQSRTLA